MNTANLTVALSLANVCYIMTSFLLTFIYVHRAISIALTVLKLLKVPIQ